MLDDSGTSSQHSSSDSGSEAADIEPPHKMCVIQSRYWTHAATEHAAAWAKLKNTLQGIVNSGAPSFSPKLITSLRKMSRECVYRLRNDYSQLYACLCLLFSTYMSLK